MANTSVNLVLYTKLTDTGGRTAWRYLPAALTKNGRVHIGYALVGGREQHCPDAAYYLDYRENGKRKYEKLARSDSERPSSV